MMPKHHLSNTEASVLAGAMICVAVGISSFVFMWAWNIVIHGAFNGPEIDFGTAVATLCLIGFLKSIVTIVHKS